MRAILGLLLGATLALPASGQDLPAEVFARASALVDARDHAAAIALLEAEAGPGPARSYALAHAYLSRATADGGPLQDHLTDIGQALDHARSAADAGDVRAHHLLYRIHSLRIGGFYRPAPAAASLRLGAEAGDVPAMADYARALYVGTSEIPRDEARACHFVDRLLAGEQGRDLVAHIAGQMLIQGKCGRAPDAAAGVAMIRAAAEQGDAGAQRDLGVVLERGFGVARDETQAAQWFLKAAEGGDHAALWHVGMAYLQGRLGPRDPASAMRLFERSAELGDARAIVSMATMYANGEGVTHDYEKAFALYMRAVELDQPGAHRAVAWMHAEGLGTDVDFMRARIFYLQSLALGDREDPHLRDLIEAGITTEGLDEADIRFRRWKQQREAAAGLP